MKITAIELFDEFIRLEKEWNDLHSRSANDSLFLSWIWMRNWWEIYGDGQKNLYVIVVRNDKDKIIAIAPLIRNRYLWRNCLPIEQIRFLGTGEDERDEVCSEYLDFIVDAEENGAVIADNLVKWLVETGHWDEIYLEQLREDSFAYKSFMKNSGDKKRHQAQEIGRSYYLSLPHNWDTLLESFGRSQRYRVKKSLKELEKQGTVELRVAKNIDEVDELFSQLVNLHQKNWTGKGLPGAFSSDMFFRFHNSVIKQFHSEGNIFLAVLSVDGKPYGAVYNYIFKNKMNSYQAGIDPGVSKTNNKIKPGIAVHALALKCAIESGINEYDFLFGNINNHKSQWTSSSRPIYCISITGSSARGRFINTSRRAGNLARRCFRLIKSLRMHEGKQTR